MMQVPHAKWAKWILISSIKPFKVMADANGIYFHIKDTPDRTASKDKFIEVSIDGPTIIQQSKGLFKLTVGVNVRYSVDTSNNYQDDVILSGLIAEAFSEICVYKYGDGDAFVGRMLPEEGTIKIINFGIINLETKIKQGSVEAIYTMFLEN